jgi:O-antigen ligase
MPLRLAPLAAQARRRQVAQLLATCGVLVYVAALHKFVVRPPLGADVGFQGMFELTAVGLACLLACAAAIALEQPIRAPLLIPILFGLFGTAALFSSLNSFYPMLSAAKAVLYLLTLISAVLLCSVLGPRTVLHRVYWSMVLILVAGVVTGLVLSSDYPLFTTSEQIRNRFSIFANHPGVLADYLAVTMLIGPLMRPRAPWWLQVVLFVVLLLTGSRTAIASFTAIVLIGGVLGASAGARWARMALAGLVLAGVAALVLLPSGQIPLPPVLDNLASSMLTQTQRDLTNLNGRVPLWASVVELLNNATLFGYGFDGTRALTLALASWAGTAHNGYLDLMLSSGVPGAVAYLVGWLLVLAEGARLKPAHQRVAYYSVNVYLMASAIVGGLLSEGTGFGSFLLIVLAFVALERSPAAAGIADRRRPYAYAAAWDRRLIQRTHPGAALGT